MWGVVTTESPLAVTLAGDTEATSVAAVASGYTPVEGHTVAVDRRGNKLVVAYRIVAA